MYVVRGKILTCTWLTCKIITRRAEDREEIIRRLIAPIVHAFEGETWFKSFHFLNYGDREGFHIKFRVKLQAEKKDFLRASVETKKNEVNNDCPIITWIDYEMEFVDNPNVLKQEQTRFGTVGLEIFLRYFEWVSRTVIALLERPEEEIAAYPVKFRMTLELFHFLLNPLLYPSFDGDGEISAHVQAILERSLTLVNFFIDQGKSKEDALRILTGSASLVDKNIGLKVTLARERS